MRLPSLSLFLAASHAIALTFSHSLDRTQTSESLESPEPPASEPPETSTHGDLNSYIIFPTAGADPNAFLTTIENLVAPQVPQAVELPDRESRPGAPRVLAWVASLTDPQIEDIKRSSAVAGLEKHEEVKSPLPHKLEDDGQQPLSPARQSLSTHSSGHNLVKRAQIYNLATSDYEMIQLSTPKGKKPATTYDIDSSGGAGVSVYVVDISVLVGHEEFTKYTKRSIRELNVPGPAANGENVEPPPWPFHGTCVASKAVGATLVRIHPSHGRAGRRATNKLCDH